MSEPVLQTDGEGDATLHAVLDQAWYNVRHHDTLRSSLVRLYMILVAGWVALLAFDDLKATLIPATLLLVLFGWMTMRTAVRYKERIVRDMRIVYMIQERLLISEHDAKIIGVFKDYRQPRGAKKPPPRLSSTRHLLLAINLINSFVVGWSLATLAGSVLLGVGVGAAMVLVQEAMIVISRRHLAFNI